MAHVRQTIREAIKAALLSHTAAGLRVYETRMIPHKRLELPAVAVYTLRESVDPESRKASPRELERELSVAIEAAVKQGENVDDAMDDIALEIERAVHADPTFGGVCADSLLSETSMDVDEAGDQPVGIVILTYAVKYQTGAPEADEALDDFESAGVLYPLGGGVSQWLPLHAYAVVGERAENAGSIYEVVAAGTSAASGGPTGVGTDITDGAVHWCSVGEAKDEIDVPTE